MGMASGLGIKEIWQAKKRISSIINKTPLIHSAILSEKAGREVYLKLETIHVTGSFKIRGAANKILSLTDEQKNRGVVTYSTGNHGMAVAYVAKQLGIEALVCISKRVPPAKVVSLKRLGAQIEVVGESQDAAGIRCYELQETRGMTVIEPFDDPLVIAGQGTIGLELLEDLPSLTDVVVPLSGGGLVSGIGLAIKSNNPAIRLTGVSMEKSAVMYESLKAGKPLEMEETETLADSLLGGIGLSNRYTFHLCERYMDRALLIPEREIASAMGCMIDHHHLIVEGAASTAVAAVLGNKFDEQKGPVAIIISGHNVDMSVLLNVMEQYESQKEH